MGAKQRGRAYEVAETRRRDDRSYNQAWVHVLPRRASGSGGRIPIGGLRLLKLELANGDDGEIELRHYEPGRPQINCATDRDDPGVRDISHF